MRSRYRGGAKMRHWMAGRANLGAWETDRAGLGDFGETFGAN